LDKRFVKYFRPIFSASGKLSESEKRKIEARNIEALLILHRVYRGQPPFTMPSREAYFVAEDALRSENIERLRTGKMTEDGKASIRDKLVETVKTLIREVAGKSEQRSTALRIVALSVLTEEEIRRVETRKLTESDWIGIRRKIDEGFKSLRKQLTGNSAQLSLFLQDAIDFANRLMTVHELPVLRGGSDSRRGGVKGHNKTYGTKQARRRNWAHWQEVFDRLRKEHPSWNLNTVYIAVSKEVRQVNGKPVKPDTIRHHVKNPVKNPKRRVR
jgi:hypothetical protein